MIELNLLPPEEKNSLRLSQTQRWIIFYGSAVLGSLSIFIVLLAVIWLSLFIQLKSLNASLDVAKQSQQGQDLKTQQDLIKELNAQIEKISQFEKTHKSYSPVLLALAKIMPVGTKLERLTLDEKNKMAIFGYAATREAVLNLKNSLEKSALFTKIDSPLTNLIKQTDINFSFSLDAKTSDLNQ